MKKVLFKDICAIVVEENGSSVIKFICRTDTTNKNFIGLKSGKKYHYYNGRLVGNGKEFDCTLYLSPCAAIGLTNAFYRGINKEVSYRNIVPNIKYKKFMKMIDEENNPSGIVSVKKLLQYEKYFYKTYKREVKAKQQQPMSEQEKIRNQYFDSTIQPVQEEVEVIERLPEEIKQEEPQNTHIIQDQIDELLNRAKANVDNYDNVDELER